MTAQARTASYAADPLNGGIPGMGKGIPAPAAVKVRVSGDMPGIAAALLVIHDAARTWGFEISGQTRPYPNRREPGHRVYITLRFPPEEDTRSCGAAHRRQAIRRPAAPSRRHLP